MEKDRAEALEGEILRLRTIEEQVRTLREAKEEELKIVLHQGSLNGFLKEDEKCKS